MTAQPFEPSPAAWREPTIRSVRAALPEGERASFQAEIERTPLHQLAEVLQTWDLRARAFASPAIAKALRDCDAERAGERQPEPLLTEDEIYATLPGLRP